MYNNLGFTLTPDSMNHFADAPLVMLVSIVQCFTGSTGYPIVLRFIIWTMTKILRKDHKLQRLLKYLLDHPRRCYTLLFTGKVTTILLGFLSFLTSCEVIGIMTLDLHNQAVTHFLAGSLSKPLSHMNRFLAALFQAVNSRHTGASVFK